MTDEEIVLYFNEHRLAKLESYLLKDGSSVEHELQNLLDRFYEQIVPEHERVVAPPSKKSLAPQCVM